jgi:hypothetical protein
MRRGAHDAPVFFARGAAVRSPQFASAVVRAGATTQHWKVMETYTIGSLVDG